MSKTGPNRTSHSELNTSQLLANAERAIAEGVLPAAVAACQGILERNPKEARAHYLLGVALARQRKGEAALKHLSTACRFLPQEPLHWVAWGEALLGNNALQDAERAFLEALKRSPMNADALRAYGTLHMNAGRFGEAIGCISDYLLQSPKDSAAFNMRGFALQQLGRPGEASGNFYRALMLRPKFPEAYNNLGNALHELGRYDEALAAYDMAQAQDPDYDLPHSNRVNALAALGRLEDALESSDRAIQLNAKLPSGHANRGLVLQHLARHEAAIESLRQAIKLKPDYLEAINNLGLSLQQLGRLDEALGSYERVLHLRPDYAEGHWNRGLLLLLKGELQAGWKEIEWRWRCRAFEAKPGLAGVAEWQGEDTAGKTIAVFAEQGFGDLIQFCRYARLLADRGAKVTLVVPATMVRLLTTFDHRVRVLPKGAQLGDVDCQCTVLGLPLRFQTALNAVPREVPYLQTEPERVEKWRRLIGPAGFKVGISWQGNPAGFVDRGRSIPLAAFAPLAGIPGVRLISLQYQHGLEQLKDLPEATRVEVLPDFNDGPDAFIDTAAAMQCMDLVITSDSAPAHLAGALNRPVWNLVKAVPDWRWLLGRSDSPWYPGMRLFRQRMGGTWPEIMLDVAKALREIVENQSGQRL